jgi:hypothetical protein
MIMATVTRTYLIDDLNGSTEDVSAIQFSLDRTDYEIDLDATNQARLRDNLAKYLIAAAIAAQPRRSTRRPPRGEVKAIPAGREQTQAVRDWARAAGYEISSRGRIPVNVQEAFDLAH